MTFPAFLHSLELDLPYTAKETQKWDFPVGIAAGKPIVGIANGEVLKQLKQRVGQPQFSAAHPDRISFVIHIGHQAAIHLGGLTK